MSEVAFQDYRIVISENDTKFELALVSYNNEREVIDHTALASSSDEQEIVNLCRQMYEASLKAPVFVDEEGYL